MEFDILTKERRSIRSYQPSNPVSKSTIEEIIKTTLLAPTWKNTETGRYYIAVNEKAISKVRSTLPVFNQKSTIDAAAFIVTTYEKGISGFTKGEADNELGDKWGAYDLGLQNAYLVLKAKELGLDSLIMGLRDADALRELLEIPESEEIGPVIALGYRKGEAVIRKRKSMDDVAKLL